MENPAIWQDVFFIMDSEIILYENISLVRISLFSICLVFPEFIVGAKIFLAFNLFLKYLYVAAIFIALRNIITIPTITAKANIPNRMYTIELAIGGFKPL